MGRKRLLLISLVGGGVFLHRERNRNNIQRYVTQHASLRPHCALFLFISATVCPDREGGERVKHKLQAGATRLYGDRISDQTWLAFLGPSRVNRTMLVTN
jgi:hypothetical protein